MTEFTNVAALLQHVLDYDTRKVEALASSFQAAVAAAIAPLQAEIDQLKAAPAAAAAPVDLSGLAPEADLTALAARVTAVEGALAGLDTLDATLQPPAPAPAPAPVAADPAPVVDPAAAPAPAPAPAPDPAPPAAQGS